MNTLRFAPVALLALSACGEGSPGPSELERPTNPDLAMDPTDAGAIPAGLQQVADPPAPSGASDPQTPTDSEAPTENEVAVDTDQPVGLGPPPPCTLFEAPVRAFDEAGRLAPAGQTPYSQGLALPDGTLLAMYGRIDDPASWLLGKRTAAGLVADRAAPPSALSVLPYFLHAPHLWTAILGADGEPTSFALETFALTPGEQVACGSFIGWAAPLPLSVPTPVYEAWRQGVDPNSQSPADAAIGHLDFTGDGVSDLVLTDLQQHGENPVARIYDGGDVGREPVARLLYPYEGFTAVTAGDFDGDGIGDLVWIHQNSGTVRMWRGPLRGDRNYDVSDLPTVPSFPRGTTYTLAAGDVDNDGDDELVVGTTTYLNRSADKAMLFLEPEEGMDYDHPDTSWQHATAGIKVFPKVVPDMNGDGHAEVLLTFDGWRRPGAFLQDDVSDGLFIVDPTRRGPVHLETEGVLVEPRGDIDRLNYAASVVVDANGDGRGDLLTPGFVADSYDGGGGWLIGCPDEP